MSLQVNDQEIDWEKWQFLEINDEKPAVNYPITVYRFGNVPLKAPSKSGSSGKKSVATAFLDDDFADIDADFKDDFDDEFDDDEEEDDGFGDDFIEDELED